MLYLIDLLRTLFYHNFVALGFSAECSRIASGHPSTLYCPKAQGLFRFTRRWCFALWLCRLHFLCILFISCWLL